MGDPGFESRKGQEIFVFSKTSRPALGPTLPFNGKLAPFLGVKQSGREVDHLTPPTAEVKNDWSYNSTPPTRFHGVIILHVSI
jgi:hypothetical protein